MRTPNDTIERAESEMLDKEREIKHIFPSDATLLVRAC